jgi:hypothetical protein
MKTFTRLTVAAILAALLATSAHAWGPRQQGFLWGVGTALLLPSLLYSGTRAYYDTPYYGGYWGGHWDRHYTLAPRISYRYYDDRRYTPPPPRYDDRFDRRPPARSVPRAVPRDDVRAAPPPRTGPAHRSPRAHNYVNHPRRR